MAAGAGKLSGVLQGAGGKVDRDEPGCAEGQRARLVEHDMVAGGDTFERVAGFEVCAAPEQASCGDDLDDGRSQGKCAGAGDDQGRNSNQDGFAQAQPRQPPAEEGEQRRRVDDRDLE